MFDYDYLRKLKKTGKKTLTDSGCLGGLPAVNISMLIARLNSGSHDFPFQLTFLLTFCDNIFGHCLVILPCTINEIVKWLTSLPILMRKSFWW